MVESINPEESPASLRARGIQISSVRPYINWRPVKTTEEYEAVVALRTKAYAEAGKIDSEKNEPMRDKYDEDAHILAGWHFSKPVVSVRIMPHPSGTVWEHQQFISLDSPEIPPLTETAEVTRVCIDPEWRGYDLSKLLFQQMVLEIFRCGRRYLLGSSTTDLLPLYLKIGSFPTSLRYTYNDLGGGEHIIFVSDCIRVVNGYLISWPIWSVVWFDVQKQAVVEGILAPPPKLQALKLLFWGALKPVFEWIEARRRAKRKRR